ncbi:MAG: tetratricopeptide repeat protein [Octadecabacter sp.]
MNTLIRGAIFAAACQICTVFAGGVAAQHNDAPTDPAFAAAYAEVGDARSLVLENNYDAARAIVAPLAEAGNPVAQNLLGIILEHADDDSASFLPALDAYAQAMAQGYGKAFYNAAMIYGDGGVDVPVDLPKMMQTYRDGADIGYAPAHEEWVWHLLFGDDAIADHAAGFVQALAGVERYPESARLRTLLADAYYYGLGTPQDYVAALDQYVIAADLGDENGQFSAGFQYFYGEGTPVDDTRARIYFEQAADQDYGWAYGYLAHIYFVGYSVTPDYDRAFAYAQLGDGRDDGQAAYFLGEAYRTGEGTAQDLAAAQAAFVRSRDAGYAWALLKLGDMAYFGQGEPENFAKAFDLFEQAIVADPNAEDGYYSLGYMVMYGEGVDADYGRAAQLLEQAIALGHIDAVIEAIFLYGSRDFAGSHSDTLRAHALCLHSMDAGYLTGVGDEQDIMAICTDVETTLTDAQKLQARMMADAL